MPTKRRRLANRQIGIPAAAVEAWRVGDFHGLNQALGVYPHQFAPWPLEVSMLGVNPDGPDHREHDPIYGWERAVALQRALLAICPPGRVGRHGQPLGPAHGN